MLRGTGVTFFLPRGNKAGTSELKPMRRMGQRETELPWHLSDRRYKSCLSSSPLPLSRTEWEHRGQVPRDPDDTSSHPENVPFQPNSHPSPDEGGPSTNCRGLHRSRLCSNMRGDLRGEPH